ncbi:MAG: RNA-binding S4 domain-containing protein [Rhodoferax sp.]|nr:RNA-binding S4 domain-containing protein [Actinomycetota bacterium]
MLDRDGIRLGQFLKLAGLIESGADAKGVLAGGSVTVNDAPEPRRGRQRRRGDAARLGEQAARVA